MKKSRFTEAQIMGVLRPAEAGVAVPELCREHGISSATFDLPPFSGPLASRVCSPFVCHHSAA